MAKKGRLSRRKRPIEFDEVLRAGPVQIGRLGRIVVFQNIATEEQIAEFKEELANQYPICVQQINDCIISIQALVADLSPLQLLQRASFEFFFAHAGKKSEVEFGHEGQIAARMIDYVQSVIVSTPPTADEPRDLEDEDWNKLKELVTELFDILTARYFLCQTAFREREEGNIDHSTEQLFVELQLHWMIVRSNRYMAHDIPHIEDLLSPHSDIIHELFGISASEIVKGMERIRDNLSRGFGDAIFALDKIKSAFHVELQKHQNNYTDSKLGESKPYDEAVFGKIVTELDMGDELASITGRLFGFDLFDVGSSTSWPNGLLRQLAWAPGEETDFFLEGELAGWPLRVWPIFRRPFIVIDQKFYCFDIQNLFDNFYRQMQRLILRLEPDYAETWNSRQNVISESLPVSLLHQLLPGAEIHSNVHYKAPDWCEADAVVIYGDILFVVEIKAGAFTRYPPTTDYVSYLKGVKELITKPAIQAHRLLKTLNASGTIELCSEDHQVLRVIGVDDVRVQVPLCITLDNLTYLAARSSTLDALDNEISEYPVWSIAIDDLRIFNDVVNRPAIFCHFVEQRLKAVKRKIGTIHDEVDHLGLYLSENYYVEYFEKFDGEVAPYGFSSDVDEYYFNLGQNGENVQPPRQPIPKELDAVISHLEIDPSGPNLRTTSVFLDFGADGRSAIASHIRLARERGKALGHAILASVFSENISITISCCGPGYPANKSMLLDQAYAETLRQLASERLLVLVDFNQEDSVRGVDANFLRSTDIEPADRERIEGISVEQARRRVARHSGKIGRNELCPCGSGKKFKKCCIGMST